MSPPKCPTKVRNGEFETSKRLGAGCFGEVYRGKENKTGREVAIKFENKQGKSAPQLEHEVEVLNVLRNGIPNIQGIAECLYYGVEGSHNCMVMELLGKSLEDRMVECKNKLNVRTTVLIAEQVIQRIEFLHSRGLVHRDIKPENWLLATKDDISNCTLKLIDFGFSRRFSPEVKLKSRVGTPYYIAPEVIEGCYDEKADVWSLGVIAYLLLSGGLPFMARATSEILDMVQNHAVKLSGKGWDKVSEDAKAMVKTCLRRDSLKRPTAQEALRDTWVAAALADKRHRTLSPLDVHNFKAYSNMHKVKKATLTVIATQLTEPNIIQLKKTFMSMDKNCDGTLSMKEVREGMLKSGVSLPENFNQLVDDVDNDGSGAIDYTEFLAATLDRKQYYQRDVLWNAFRKFDIDGSGTIEKKELMHILGNQEVQDVMNMHMQELSRLFDEIDSNKDGIIDFDEFFKMMQASGGSLEFE